MRFRIFKKQYYMPTITNIHDQLYEYYSWSELQELSLTLAEKVQASGKRYDRLIAIAKGGLAFARSTLDYLDIPDVSTIKIEFYTNIGETNKAPVVSQDIPIAIFDENILLFDDIVDKGDTLLLAKQYVEAKEAASVETAVLIQKPWTKVQSDFYAKESSAWVIFPNEVRETVGLLQKNWARLGDSLELIQAQLLQIGFSERELALLHLEK